MKNDLQSYRSAVSASIRGLILQAVLAAVVLIYAIRASDPAAMTAAIFMWIGVLAWLALTIVYDQHRRERIEALEAETLSAAAAPSVFDGQDQEFRPAARRLQGLYKFFFPGMSLLIGGLLVGLGYWRFTVGREAMRVASEATSGSGAVSPHGLWALGIGLTIAVIGFVYARYTAGMAKQEVWANLRGGAAIAVGSALLGFFLALAHFIDRTLGPDWLVRALPIGFSVLLMVIGVEVFINFLMGVYRPRRAGEIPHPAFESRLLGFAAAPDRIAQSVSEAINYQLGFDVTSGWFYQLISRWLGGLLLIGVLVVWLLSSIAVVQPHQRGMILQFGKVVREDVPPGAHLKMPWPFQTLQIPEYITRDEKGRYQVTDLTATGVRTLQLGSAPPATNEILWTNEHVGEEVYQYVRAGAQALTRDEEALDIAIVSVEIPMQYSVRDVLEFDSLAPPRQRDELLRRIAQREVLGFFRTQTLSQVLGPERRSISDTLRERIQYAFDHIPDGEGGTRSAGVDVLFVGLSGVHPPRETASSFERVVQADQRRQANINAAEAEAIKTLTTAVGDIALANEIVRELDRLEQMQNNNAPREDIAEQEFNIQKLLERAGGSAASLLAEASAERWERHMGVRGRAARYEGQLAMFRASPNIYRASLYFDAVQTAMKNSRVYITSEDIPNLRIDVELQDKDVGVDLFSKDQN